MRTTLIGLAAAGCAILGLAGCGSGATTSTIPTTAATAAPTLAPTTAPATSVPTAAPAVEGDTDPLGLTGLGAYETAWNARHQLDSSKSGGDAYLPAVAGGGDTWASVTFAKSHGYRVVGYDYQTGTGNGISASAMKGYVRQQLPSDAVVLGDVVQGGSLAPRQCEIIAYKSATLARAFSDPEIGDPQGYAMVVFTSSGTPDFSYDPNQVDGAGVSLGSGPADLTGSC